MISSRNLAALPGVNELRRLMQSLAMLDALMEREWEYRYFSFNSRWSDTEQMGSMRNGSGDDLFALFDQEGCFLRGFDHESAMSPWATPEKRIWRGVLEEVPPEFSASLREPAFHMEDTTFCIWRRVSDSAWSRGSVEFPEGDDPDGSAWMLSMYEGHPDAYINFARDYFEVAVPVDAVQQILAHAPLTQSLAMKFPSSGDYEALRNDADEIGYPC